MDKDIDDVLQEAASAGNFEGEVWLSTDGKHTVRVKADSKDGRKDALNWAKLVYEGIKASYGTKQEQAVKAYSKEAEKQEECQHPETTELTVKNGKNAGRKFLKCNVCGTFVRFIS